MLENDDRSRVGQEGIEALVETTCESGTNGSYQDSAERILWDDFGSDSWVDVYRQLELRASLKEIASHCILVENTGSGLDFIIEEDNASLYNENHQQSLAEVLSHYFAKPIIVRINVGVSSSESPRTILLREQNRISKEALDSLNADPSIAEFKRVFDGTVEVASVVPRE